MRKLVLVLPISLAIGVWSISLATAEQWWLFNTLLVIIFLATGVFAKEAGAVGLGILAVNNLAKAVGPYLVTTLDLAVPAYVLGLVLRRFLRLDPAAPTVGGPPEWWPTWAFVLFAFSGLVGYFAAGEVVTGFLGLKRLLVYLLLGYGIYVGARTQRAINWSIFAIALQVIWISFQGLRGSTLSQDSISYMGDYALVDAAARTALHFGNAATLGQYLMMCLPFLLGSYFEEKKAWTRGLYLLAAVMGVACLLLTLSRGPWLGMLVSSLFVAAFTWRSKSGKIAIIGSATVLLVALTLAPSGLIFQRFLDSLNFREVSTATRLEIYPFVYALLVEHPLRGYGIGFTFKTLKFAPVMQTYAHNTYLQFWLEQGVLGFISFLGILVGLVVAGLRRFGKLQPERHISLIWKVSFLVGLMVHFLVDYTFYNDRVFPTFFALLGLYGASLRVSELNEIGG